MIQPIIDAHHHIWRQADLPWLTGPMVPRIFGPYEAIRRDYPAEEFLADLAGSGVVKSVYVQDNWGPGRGVDEAEWVQSEAGRTGWPHAIVAYADLMAEDVRPELDRLARVPLVRGVRMQLHWHDNPDYRFAKRPDLADDPLFRRNFAALADYGYSFDLQVFAPQMDVAARLVADHPETTFILQHAGMLEDLSDAGREEWREGMRLPRGAAEHRGEALRPSAPSSTATTRRMSRGSCARRRRCSARTAACSARTFQSRSCGPTTLR